MLQKFSYSDPRVSVPVRIKKDKFEEGHLLNKSAIKQIKFVNNGAIFEFFIEQAKKNINRLKRYQDSRKEFNVNVNILIKILKS